MTFAPESFRDNVSQALKDQQLRQNIKGATDYFAANRQRTVAADEHFEQLREQGRLIKQRCLAKLPELLEQLEHKLTANGIKVHWAQTTEQANETIAQLLAQHGATRAVKGKSMVSEETELNDHLNARGVETLETDMGEYIVQLEHERPSHILAPAIHKNKVEVAQIFDKHIEGLGYTEDVDALILAARHVMRDKFKQADVGITGVNFAVAQTGTLCLVENEGNGRMCSTVPDLHIAITGIEKVVESLSDIPPLLSLLTRSATGQVLSTYFNMISHPRKSGEKDGPKAVHLVLLDNGRSDAFDDEAFRQTLQCIRCSACMNHCPVYRRVGGHAYGTVYPGPIGQILTPHMQGLDKTQDLPTASTLCGSCAEVCPVKIPIPQLLLRLRMFAQMPDKDEKPVVAGQGAGRKSAEAFIWWLWRYFHQSGRRYRLLTYMLTKMRWALPRVIKPWTDSRELPTVAKMTLHQRVKLRQRQQGAKR